MGRSLAYGSIVAVVLSALAYFGIVTTLTAAPATHPIEIARGNRWEYAIFGRGEGADLYLVRGGNVVKHTAFDIVGFSKKAGFTRAVNKEDDVLEGIVLEGMGQAGWELVSVDRGQIFFKRLLK